MMPLLDILECSISGLLLLYLCQDAIVLKKNTRQGKCLFFLLFVIWKLWLGNSKWLSELLYGKSTGIQESSISIVKLVLTMGVCFLLLDIFYEGNRLVKAYLVLLFEAVIEMARFGIHCFWSLGVDVFYQWMANRLIEEKIPAYHFENLVKISQYFWLLSLMIPYLAISWMMIRAIRKYRGSLQDISRQGVLFLMLSPAIGMVFDLVWRCLFFTRTGNQIDYIYDKHRGMYAAIPVMTFLCLISIVYSIKIYEELIRTQEEKSNLIFYKQQLSDMTAHVSEMEQLYDSIRGMRHDMNNYIADMEQLLGMSMQQGILNASIESEAQKYLYHMKDALDNLAIRYHTGNPVMDVIVNRKWRECEKAGIEFLSDFFYPEQLGIEAFDLGILMNNALDNAIDACKKCMGKKDKSIRIHSYNKGRMLFLRIENDCNSAKLLYSDGKNLRTTKEDDWMHGIGLKNMNRVVERYYGTMHYEVRDQVFFLTIMLQGTQDFQATQDLQDVTQNITAAHAVRIQSENNSLQKQDG